MTITEVFADSGEVIERDMTPEELAQYEADKAAEEAARPAREKAAADAARRAAYAAESDPVFFKWQRGEATEQEWLDAVAAVKAAHPDPVILT